MFGVIQSSANSTLDQTNLFTDQVYDVYHSFPESASIFQITNPSGGFGGMVTKPWSQRKKTTQQLLIESAGPLSKIAGVRVIPLTPPPLPGGGNFPVDFVIASAAEPEQVSQLAEQIVQKAMASGMFIFADTDVKFDQPQTEVVFRPRQTAFPGCGSEPGGPRPLHHAGRKLRQPFQHSGTQLQSDSAGQTRGAPHCRISCHRFT